MTTTDGELSAAFRAFWKEILPKLEAAAQNAGPGYEVRTGDGHAMLCTSNGLQQLVFRRRRDRIEVAFVNLMRHGNSTNDYQKLHPVVSFRRSEKADAYITQWLERYGPGPPRL